MPARECPQKSRTERILVGTLFLLMLFAAIVTGWVNIDSTPPEPPVHECAIHAHDQAEVGACLDR